VLRAQRAQAASDLMTLAAALEQFRQDCGRYPTAAEGVTALLAPPPQLSGWRGPYTRGVTDPWGGAFSYIPPPTPTSGAYRLTSAGPDMRAGTADDLTATGPAAPIPGPGGAGTP